MKAYRAFRNDCNTYYLSGRRTGNDEAGRNGVQESCPYDAMGDYSGLLRLMEEKDEPDEKPIEDTG